MTALVPYGSTGINDGSTSTYTTADATKLKRDFSSPHDLIIHESLRNMIAEVAGLRDRCECLETANAELMIKLHRLEQAYDGNMVQLPLTKANLTGYAFSDAASTGSRGESSDSNDSVEQQFAAVTGVLKSYEQRFESLAIYLAQQEQCVTELITYKRSTEVLFRALKDELSGLNVAELDKMKLQTTNGGVDANITDKHDKLEERLAGLELKVENNGSRLDAYADLPGHVQNMCNKQEKYRVFRRTTLRKFRHEQIIDDASTKDALFALFKSTEDLLVSDGLIRRSGPFEATFDEIMPLRERIFGRLASWDANGAAFEEAKEGAKKVF